VSDIYYAKSCFDTNGEPLYRPLCETKKRGKLFSWADPLLDVFPPEKRRRTALESYQEVDLKWCDGYTHLPIGDICPIPAHVDLALTDSAYLRLRQRLEPFGDFYAAKNISDGSTIWLYCSWSFLNIKDIYDAKQPILCNALDDGFSMAMIANEAMKDAFEKSFYGELKGLCFCAVKK
jgi:hypothetical protein